MTTISPPPNLGSPGAVNDLAAGDSSAESSTNTTFATGAAGFVAEAVLNLEESGATSRDMARRSRRLRSERKLSAIKKQRKAARFRLAAGVVQGSGQIASGGLNALGAAKNKKVYEGSATAAKGAGDVAGAVLSYRAELRDADAKEANVAAERAADSADVSQEAAQSADRFAGRASDHVSAILEAQHQAQITATRA